MIALTRRLFFVSLVAVLAVNQPAADGAKAQAPATHTESLASWTNADVGLCLEIDNLADHCDRFTSSTMCDRLRRFPPLAQAWEQHRPGLEALAGEIKRRSGASPLEIGRKLLGSKALFAIWPPANPATDKPDALVLIDAPDEQFMRATLEKLVGARKRVGRWKGSRSLGIGAATVTVDLVVPDDDQSQFFIASSGNMAALSTNQELLRAAFERRATDDRASSLAELPSYKAAQDRLSPHAVARLWINPRLWAPALEADLKTKAPGSDEARMQAALVEIWKATDYVATALRLTPQLGIELAGEWDSGGLPAAVRDAVESCAGGARFVDKVPADALLAVAGHADFGRLTRSAVARQWQEAATTSIRQSDSHNERILFWALSVGLGPDWGFWIEGAKGSSTDVAGQMFPFSLTAGIQTQPLGMDHSQAALADNLEPLLHALVAANVESINLRAGKEMAEISSDPHAGATITTVTGLVPGKPRQELAFGVDRERWLWFGTSGEAIERAASNTAAETLRMRLGGKPEFSQTSSPGTLVYVNLAGWRKLASLGRPAFEFLWEGKQVADKTKDEQFQAWVTFSQLADVLLFTSSLDASGFHAAIEIE